MDVKNTSQVININPSTNQTTIKPKPQVVDVVPINNNCEDNKCKHPLPPVRCNKEVELEIIKNDIEKLKEASLMGYELTFDEEYVDPDDPDNKCICLKEVRNISQG